jgi:hypothetical protein
MMNRVQKSSNSICTFCITVSEALSHKLDILKKMNLDDVCAAIPLLQFPVTKLRSFALLAEKESVNVPQGSRLKYICGKLQVYL